MATRSQVAPVSPDAGDFLNDYLTEVQLAGLLKKDVRTLRRWDAELNWPTANPRRKNYFVQEVGGGAVARAERVAPAAPRSLNQGREGNRGHRISHVRQRLHGFSARQLHLGTSTREP